MSTTLTEAVEAPNVERAVIDRVVDAIGLDAAAEIFREQLGVAEAEKRRHAESDSATSSSGLAGWIATARSRIKEVDRLQTAVDFLAWRLGGSVGDPPAFEPIADDAVDEIAIGQAVADGKPNPGIVGTAISTLTAIADRKAQRIAAIDAQLDEYGRCFADDQSHGVDFKKFSQLIKDLVPERAELVKAIAAARDAVESVRGYLEDHAADVVGDLDAVAASLHSKAALESHAAMASDPELKRLEADMRGVNAGLESLSFGGKLAASVKGSELTERKREIDRAIAARRRAIFASLGADALPRSRAAADGDPAALEGIIVEALEAPDCFSKGYAARLLDLQAEALETAATAILEHIAPRPISYTFGLHELGGVG